MVSVLSIRRASKNVFQMRLLSRGKQTVDDNGRVLECVKR